MEIITGYVGKKHVTSEQDRDVNQGIVGPGSYVLETGMRLEAEVSSNNEIKIRDGVLMHQGCAASIKKNTYDSLTIINGSQGMKRIDLIVARYEKNRDDETESLNLEVIQGTPVESNPAVPDYTEGDIQAGDYVADMPLYQVIIDGLNITEVKKVFETVGSNAKLAEMLAELNGKSGILTSADQNNPITEYQLYKMGKMVVFNVTNYKKGQGAVNGRVIGTIQEGFLPPHTIAISFGTSGAYQFDSSGNPGSRIFVNDAGVVTLYCNKNTGNYISFTACWVTD